MQVIQPYLELLLVFLMEEVLINMSTLSISGLLFPWKLSAASLFECRGFDAMVFECKAFLDIDPILEPIFKTSIRRSCYMGYIYSSRSICWWIYMQSRLNE